MRKCFTLLICLALAASLAAPALADRDGLKVHNATASKGQTVYLTVELTESVMANSLAVEYTYNSKHLKPVPESCSWAKTGVLQDFDSRGGAGVWTTDTVADRKGGVCVLAFQVKALAVFRETEVTCTLIARGEGQEKLTFTATGKVILDCEHSYGDWTDAGALGHYQVCSSCGGKHTQNHQWDAGTVTEDPEKPGAAQTVYTCKVCGGTQAVREDTQRPADGTTPTEGDKKPSTLKPESQNGETGRDQQGSTGSQQGSTGADGHDHSGEQTATGATVSQQVLDAVLGDHAGHDHSGEDSGTKNYTGPAIAVAVTLAAAIGAMVLFVRRRK